jgi:S-DNA-T family DNA segregation ATPase FtsK/SpoIIIE
MTDTTLTSPVRLDVEPSIYLTSPEILKGTVLPAHDSRGRRLARWARAHGMGANVLPSTVRGGRRVVGWVYGAEGAQARAARDHARALTRDSERAARRARLAIRDRDTKSTAAGLAKTESAAALATAQRTTQAARGAMGVRAAIVGIPASVALSTGYATAGWWGAAAASLPGILGLAWGGRPVADEGDEREIEPAATMSVEAAPGVAIAPGETGKPGWDASLITEAFRAAGIIKAGQAVRLVAPPARDRVAEATTLVVDLPAGVTADSAIGRRAGLAAALERDESQLYLTRVRGDRGHAGRLSVWLMDADPFDRDPARSPLLGIERASLWDSIPVGVDSRGQEIPLRLVDASLLIAGEPRAGKTVATNAIIAAAALSPQVKLLLFDGKGAGDHRPWRRIAQVAVKRDPRMLLDYLIWAQEEMERVFDLLESQEAGSKLTPDLCQQLGIDITLIVVDETRYYLTDSKHGAAITRLCVDIASRGPAAGVLLVLASQRMTVDAIPGPLRGVCSLRWAMRCPDVTASNAVLGEGKAGKGWDASTIRRDQRGVGILDADGETPVLMRSYLLEDADLVTIAERAYALREAAGTLPDHSNQREVVVPGAQTVRDVLTVMAAAGVDRMRVETILTHLAQHEPGTYKAMDTATLGRLLREGGAGTTVALGPLDGMANPKGYKRAQLESAADKGAQ